MQPQQTPPKRSLARTVIITTICATALFEAPPVYFGGYNIVHWAACGGLVTSMPPLLSWTFNKLAQKLDIVAANINSRRKGDAAWASYNDLRSSLLHPRLFNTGHGGFWGTVEGKPIITDDPAICTIHGATGSGKDSYHLISNVLSTPGSKFILDFKGDLAPILAPQLRKQGEIVHIFNVDDMFTDILGESATYNTLDVLIDNFWRKDGILDVLSDLSEDAFTLYPEPKSENGNSNKFFRDGSRSLIKFAEIMTVLIEGRDAHPGEVLALLQDRERLLDYALWAAGRPFKEGQASAPPQDDVPPTCEAAND